MADVKTMPFARGDYWATGDTTSGANLEGMEYEVPDDQHGTGSMVKLRVVRNVAAIALQPKRLVSFVASKRGQVDGYARLNPNPVYSRPVDDAYTSSIPVNALFYVVVEGYCNTKTPLAAGDFTATIAAGDILCNGTAATSGATTAGRPVVVDFATTGTSLAMAVLNSLGRAVSSRTSAETDSDLLVAVGPFRY